MPKIIKIYRVKLLNQIIKTNFVIRKMSGDYIRFIYV